MDRRKQRFKKRTAVTKEQALNFLCANEVAEQNREAHQCLSLIHISEPTRH